MEERNTNIKNNRFHNSDRNWNVFIQENAENQPKQTTQLYTDLKDLIEQSMHAISTTNNDGFPKEVKNNANSEAILDKACRNIGGAPN